MRLSKDAVLIVALSLALTIPVLSPTVQAQTSCGQTITSDTILTGDLVCSGNGITFGASSISLDCKGHRIEGGGVVVQGFQNVTIKNCIIHVNGDDIFFYNTGRNNVTNCTLTSGGGNDGVYVGYSDLNAFINNSVSGGSYGFWLEGSSNNTLTGNKASRNTFGFFVSGNVIYSRYNNIENNLAIGNSVGFGLDILSSQNALISNRAFFNSYQGIELQDSSLNTIASNILENNTAYDLFLSVADRNKIVSDVLENSHIGLYLGGSSHNNISSDIVRNNAVGIDVPGPVGISQIPSNNNTIYNNIIRNDANTRDLWNNFWNVTKTVGKNILGGPYIGGNYWSDYNGTDTDADYLGDTLTPYSSGGGIANGGDRLPLLLPPGYIDYKGVGPTAISLAWGHSNNAGFSAYQLQRSNTGSAGPWTIIDTIYSISNTTSYVDSLSPVETYWWRIRDYDINGTYASLNALQVTQPNVARLASTMLTSTRVQFDWTNNAKYGGKVAFGSYQLRQSVNGGSFVAAATITSASNRSYVVSSLQASTNYSFYLVTTDVCSFCASPSPSSSDSNVVSIRTPAVFAATVHASPLSVDVGQTVTFSCSPSGGTPPYKYSWSLGDYSTASSQTVGHVYQFPGIMLASCSVADSLGSTAKAGVNITVSGDPVVRVPSAYPPTADVGQTVVFSTIALGGSGSYVYDWANLPPGCTSTNSASISCQVSAKGTFGIVVEVTDSNGFSVTSGALMFTVSSRPLFIVFTASLTTIDLGEQIIFSTSAVTAAGPSYTYSGLPFGCQTANSATLTCTPIATGVFTVTASISDSSGIALTSNSIAITVNPVPTITRFYSSARYVDLGKTISLTISSSGGTGVLSYSFTGLPPGCSPTNSSSLVCTPSRIGNYNITVTITDQAYTTATSSVNVTINRDPTIVGFTTNPPSVAVGQPIKLIVSVIDGAGSFAYSYSGLPPSCTTADAPSLTCIPSSTGSFRISVVATDDDGMAATSYVNFTVIQTVLGTAPLEGYALVGGIPVAIAATGLIAIALIRRRQGNRRPSKKLEP